MTQHQEPGGRQRTPEELAQDYDRMVALTRQRSTEALEPHQSALPQEISWEERLRRASLRAGDLRALKSNEREALWGPRGEQTRAAKPEAVGTFQDLFRQEMARPKTRAEINEKWLLSHASPRDIWPWLKDRPEASSPGLLQTFDGAFREVNHAKKRTVLSHIAGAAALVATLSTGLPRKASPLKRDVVNMGALGSAGAVGGVLLTQDPGSALLGSSLALGATLAVRPLATYRVRVGEWYAATGLPTRLLRAVVERHPELWEQVKKHQLHDVKLLTDPELVEALMEFYVTFVDAVVEELPQRS